MASHVAFLISASNIDLTVLRNLTRFVWPILEIPPLGILALLRYIEQWEKCREARCFPVTWPPLLGSARALHFWLQCGSGVGPPLSILSIPSLRPRRGGVVSLAKFASWFKFFRYVGATNECVDIYIFSLEAEKDLLFRIFHFVSINDLHQCFHWLITA